MNFYLIHDATGLITQTGQCDPASYEIMPKYLPAGTSLLALSAAPADANTFIAQNYVAAGAVTPRATMTPTVSASTITANGTSSAAVSGLPNPCSVTISGVLTAGPTPVTDGTIDLTSDLAGALVVTVTADPAFLPWSTTINAV
jgi:hypothetical protein